MDISDSYKNQINLRINSFFSDIINNTPNLILREHYIKIKNFVLRDGKRIRPLISLMSYKAVKGTIPDNIILPAISSELLHAGTLIHDDIMDEDELRRNQPSMHKLMQDVFLEEYEGKNTTGDIFKEPSARFGISMAILHGNLLYSLGEKCLHDADISPERKNILLKKYNDALGTVNEGQILDITSALMQDIDEREYIEVISKKTSGLFLYSSELGLILADSSSVQNKALTDAVKSIAVAFQVKDDIMDITDSDAKGHSLGSDIKKGNMTLPVLFALKKAGRKNKERLMNLLGRNVLTKKEADSAIDIIVSSGAIDSSERIANGEIRKARKLLDKNTKLFKDTNFFYQLIEKVYSHPQK